MERGGSLCLGLEKGRVAHHSSPHQFGPSAYSWDEHSPHRAAVHGEMTIELVLHGLREMFMLAWRLSFVGKCGPRSGDGGGPPKYQTTDRIKFCIASSLVFLLHLRSYTEQAVTEFHLCVVALSTASRHFSRQQH